LRAVHEDGSVSSTVAGDAPRSAGRHWRGSVKSSISAAMSRSRSSLAAATTWGGFLGIGDSCHPLPWKALVEHDDLARRERRRRHLLD
jgi:hypothetical protein